MSALDRWLTLVIWKREHRRLTEFAARPRQAVLQPQDFFTPKNTPDHYPAFSREVVNRASEPKAKSVGEAEMAKERNQGSWSWTKLLGGERWGMWQSQRGRQDGSRKGLHLWSISGKGKRRGLGGVLRIREGLF